MNPGDAGECSERMTDTGRRICRTDSISGIVFGCVFGSSVTAMIVKQFLPDHHLSAESKDTVKLGLGLSATLAALVRIEVRRM